MLPLLMAIFLGLALYLALSLGAAAIVKNRLRHRLRHDARGRLALTYDDGPGPKLAEPLLKLLHEHNAKASFFFVGFRAQRFPETADAIAAAGHEIGNHSQWHRHAWRTLTTPWLAVRDLHQGRLTTSRWAAALRTPSLYRPPFGKLTLWTFLAARGRGDRLCFWTADGADTAATLPDPDAIAQRIVASGGGVVLLHSHDRGEQRQRYVLAVTEGLLRLASERGLQVCTMSQVLDTRV